MISVAAELANMHPQTLRMYEARGLIEPQRSPKGTRLYSQEDVERLRRIQEMTADLGLNLAGVERVLDLEAEVNDMHARIEELEVRRCTPRSSWPSTWRRFAAPSAPSCVPYRGGGTDMVRAADVRSTFGSSDGRTR